MKFKASLSSKVHPEYGQAAIPFPISDSKYDHIIGLLENMGIGFPVVLGIIGERVNIIGPDNQEMAVQMGGMSCGH